MCAARQCVVLKVIDFIRGAIALGLWVALGKCKLRKIPRKSSATKP